MSLYLTYPSESPLSQNPSSNRMQIYSNSGQLLSAFGAAWRFWAENAASMRPAIRDATVIVSDAAIRSCDWPAGRVAGAPCSPCRNAPAPRRSRSGRTARRTSEPCPRCCSCAGSRTASRKSMKPSGPPTSLHSSRTAPGHRPRLADIRLNSTWAHVASPSSTITSIRRHGIVRRRPRRRRRSTLHLSAALDRGTHGRRPLRTLRAPANGLVVELIGTFGSTRSYRSIDVEFLQSDT